MLLVSGCSKTPSGSVPPPSFRPARADEILWARHSPVPPPFAGSPVRRTGRRAQGVRYERKAQAYLRERFRHAYIPSPWFTFSDDCKRRPRWCQPDGLIISPLEGTLTIVEIKYQHTEQAWWQVRRLYAPVLEKVFPPDLWDFRFCEVVKWFDPAITFPEVPALAANPGTVRRGAFGVHIYKP